MNVKRKVTWKDIFDNFKTLYPTLARRIADYRPHDYMSIIVWLDDGTAVIYDDTAKRAKWIAV